MTTSTNGTDRPLSFVDSNVVVYAMAMDDLLKGPVARALIDSLAAAGALRLSTQVLQESFVNLTRKGKRVLSAVEALAALDRFADLPIVQVDYLQIREAGLLSGREHISFWDALIVVSASRARAKRLYTEDLQHGRVWNGVEIVNPFLEA